MGRADSQNKLTIIGVVDDVRQYGLDADPRPTVFYPHAMFGSRTLYWTVKGSGGASALSAPIVDIVRSLDPLLPVFDVETMSDRVGDSLARQRILMTLLSLFGFIALTVAIVGLYGVLSFTVATHTREIGIRKALGAESRDLYRLVLSASTTVTGLGLVIGLGISLAGSRLVADLVHGVSTTDPMTFVLAAMVVLAVAAAASLVPARRAAAVDPLIALRQE